MCVGGGGGTDNSALRYQQEQDAIARQKEADREARIQQGRQQIDALFDRGQTLITPASTTYENLGAGTPEYDKAVGLWRQGAPFLQPQKKITTEAVWSPEGAQPAFNKQFYDERRQAYIDNYTPQLAQQFSDARNQLSFALARAGLLRSSVATDKVARLQADNAVQSATIANKAEDSVSQLRSQVEDSRTQLINQLNTSADPAGTANLALARTQATASQPVSYSPLGDVFTSVASGIGNFVTGVRQKSILDSFNLAATSARSGSGVGASGQGTTTVGKG